MRNLNGFAEACYDQNTIEDLIDALVSKKADPADCKDWNITPTRWRQEIREALEAKIENYCSLQSRGHESEIEDHQAIARTIDKWCDSLPEFPKP